MSLRIAAVILALAVPSTAAAVEFGAAPEPPTAEREPGVVVAVHGPTYVVRVGAEPAIGAGTVLQVYRRLPSARGAAPYRDAVLWWEVGRLSVTSVDAGVAVATQIAGPPVALPDGLDESGAPADRVQVGDSVRTTGAVTDRRPRSRVVFPVAELFSPEGTRPTDEGRAAIARWAKGLKAIEGPVEVRVRTRLRELGVVGPDIDRSVSITRDAGEGPVPGDPVTPIIDLHGAAVGPSEVSPARVVHVVEPGEDGVETYQYLDPVTLSQHRAAAVADLVAAAAGLEREAVLVTVVPLPELTAHEDAPGYDRGGDVVWILAGAIDWEEPAPPKPAVDPAPAEEPERPADRPRRPFERLPPDGEVS